MVPAWTTVPDRIADQAAADCAEDGARHGVAVLAFAAAIVAIVP